jgi:hypothetical protein
MPDDTTDAAKQVAARLQDKGHHEHAARLWAALAEARADTLLAVREACQTILTALEAIDPVSANLVDELRMEVDKRLGPADPAPHGTH